MLDERGIKIKEASCWFHMSCEKIGKVVEVLTQVEMKETMSVGSRGFKVLHSILSQGLPSWRVLRRITC